MIELADIARALGLLTRLPVPVDAEAAMARGARAAWAWPLVGMLVGGGAAVAGYGAALLWSSPLIAAVIALGLMTVLTGAMHEDGLADCADGFFGSHERERRLAIMKDSRIGTFGVMALVFITLLKVAALAILLAEPAIPLGLVVAAMLSRSMMVPLMWLPNARTNGLSRAVGTPPGSALSLALATACVASLLVLGWSALTAIVAAVLAAMACAAIARSKIGGQTGDVLGATQQISETAVLLTLAAL
ncbi:adenosylcobinamide-GDP ribazoletransferase [Aestuariibius insulae]|uniref:adenosylcobinamide-GDP ribazoletransferase n=1 Tax=Aestuariibius insulae TaxID=2058287 RepID=UPI00345EAFE7